MILGVDKVLELIRNKNLRAFIEKEEQVKQNAKID
jgi:hypothetical protein